MSKYFSTIEEFINDITADKMIKNAFNEIKPTKKNKHSTIIIIIVSLFFSFIVGISHNTVSIFLSIVESIMSVLLGIFGIIFTAYSIILAFLNDSYLKALSEIKENEISYLKKSTTYYESVLFLYFIGVILNVLILIFIKCIDADYVISNNNALNTTLAIILLSTYFIYIIRIIYELKSTIYNTITLFRANISYKLIEFAEKEKKQEAIRNKKEEIKKQTNESI